MKPDFSLFFQDPKNHQKSIQYYLNYYQNRKESIELIADKATSGNSSLIQLFLNHDHGSINAQYLYDNNSVFFLDFIISRHRLITFNDIHLHFHIFVPVYSKITSLDTSDHNLILAQQVLNLEPLNNVQSVPLYYIHCATLMNSLTSNNILRFKQSAQLIIKSKFHDMAYLSRVLLAFTKCPFDNVLCEWTSRLLLDNLEKSDDLSNYTIYLLFSKSVLSKTKSSAIQDVVFKILFILFHFKTTIQSFTDFVNLFSSIDDAVIDTAYNTACEALVQVRSLILPGDYELELKMLYKNDHHLFRLLALKIAAYASDHLFALMIQASVDPHSVIKEYSQLFVADYKSMNTISQSKLSVHISNESTIPYVYQLVSVSNDAILPLLLCDLINHAVVNRYYLSFQLLLDTAFTLLNYKLDKHVLSTSICSLLSSNHKYNTEKVHLFTFISYILDPSIIISNNAFNLLSFSSNDLSMQLIAQDVCLLFATCRCIVMGKTVDLPCDLLINFIVQHDTLYLEYYIFLYLSCQYSFEPLLLVDNEIKLNSIIQYTCNYYHGILHNKYKLIDDPVLSNPVKSSEYVEHIKNLGNLNSSITSIYFMLHTQLDTSHLFKMLTANMKFLSSEYADIFHAVFVKTIRVVNPTMAETREFISAVNSIDSRKPNPFILYFQHLALLVRFTNNPLHLQYFHTKKDPVYFYFSKHTDSKVQSLLDCNAHEYMPGSAQHLMSFLYSYDGQIRLQGLLQCAQVFEQVEFSDLLKIDELIIQNIPRIIDDPDSNCQLYAIQCLKSFIKYPIIIEQAAIFIKTLILYGVSNKDSRQRTLSVGLLINIIKKYEHHDALIPQILEIYPVMQQYSGLIGDDMVGLLSSLYDKLIKVLNFGKGTDLIPLVIQNIITVEIPEVRVFYYSILYKLNKTDDFSTLQLQELIYKVIRGDELLLQPILKKWCQDETRAEELSKFVLDTWPRSISKVLDDFIIMFIKQYSRDKRLINIFERNEYEKDWDDVLKYAIKYGTMDKQRTLLERLMEIQGLDLRILINLDVDTFMIKYIDKYQIKDEEMINDILMTAQVSARLKLWINRSDVKLRMQVYERYGINK